MAGRFYRIILIILVSAFCGGSVWGQSDMYPDAATVLARYRQSLSWMESVSVKIDINVVPTGLPDKGPYGITLLFVYDHGRVVQHGRMFAYDKNGCPDPNLTHTIDEVFADGRYIDFGRPANESLWRAFVGKDADSHLQITLDNPGSGSPLWGRIFGNNHKSVADLLDESTDLTMSQEILEDMPCYVLKGTTKYGKVSAWIAPQKGYNALKWSIEKRKNIDLIDDTPSPMDLWVAVFHSVKFQQINGQFVPAKGVFVLSEVPNKELGEIIARQEYTISDVQLNPDFDSIGAFKIDLPNGLRIYSQEAPGIRYKWKDGAVVPDVDSHTFEEIDKTIEGLKNQ